MSKEMVVSHSPLQTRLAIIENGVVSEVAFERDAFLYVSDVLEDEDFLTEEEEKIVQTEREIRAAAGPQQSIDQLLKQGQEVLVQVVKEPLGTKGARITSYVSLPGRLLVYMPTVDHVGVSRK